MKEFFIFMRKPEIVIGFVLSVMLGYFIQLEHNSFFIKCIVNLFCSVGIYYLCIDIFKFFRLKKDIKRIEEDIKKIEKEMIEELRKRYEKGEDK